MKAHLITPHIQNNPDKTPHNGFYLEVLQDVGRGNLTAEIAYQGKCTTTIYLTDGVDGMHLHLPYEDAATLRDVLSKALDNRNDDT